MSRKLNKFGTDFLNDENFLNEFSMSSLAKISDIYNNNIYFNKNIP